MNLLPTIPTAALAATNFIGFCAYRTECNVVIKAGKLQDTQKSRIDQLKQYIGFNLENQRKILIVSTGLISLSNLSAVVMSSSVIGLTASGVVSVFAISPLLYHLVTKFDGNKFVAQNQIPAKCIRPLAEMKNMSFYIVPTAFGCAFGFAQGACLFVSSLAAVFLVRHHGPFAGQTDTKGSSSSSQAIPSTQANSIQNTEDSGSTDESDSDTSTSGSGSTDESDSDTVTENTSGSNSTDESDYDSDVTDNSDDE